MKYLLDIEPLPCLNNVIIQDLRDLGVKVELNQLTKKDTDLPTIRKSKSKEDSLNVCGSSVVFGNSLANVPSVVVKGCGHVPRFLFDAIQLLEKSIDVEGLFRKSGSVQRLKDLRVRVDNGDSLCDAHPLDIASLLKQFLRELPEPLFTTTLHDIFVSSVRDNTAIPEAVLLACLLLPSCNLATLRYVALFLYKVAASSSVNRMDAANLAVCLAPNLLYAENSRTSVTDSSVLIAETAVIRFVVEHASNIGMVCNSLLQRAVLLSACFSSDMEEHNATTHISASTSTNGARGGVAKRKKKKRSGSLQGLVTTLSASFSRWRTHKEKNGGHNTSSISDRSTVSYVSFDKSSVMVDGDDLGTSEYNIHESVSYPTVAATPKVMRKRKAEDDTLPFSTTKKKAILSSMPHRSILGGTPFTPHVKKGLDLRHRPDIEFAPDADDMVFSATTPKLASAKTQTTQHVTSVSSSRLRRKNSLGKSGCFSPKTPKGGLRHSFRGFLRRLSGSKDRQNQSTGINVSQASDMVDRISTSSSDQVMSSDSRPGSCRKMVSTLFGRRQKTPSLSNYPVSSFDLGDSCDTVVDVQNVDLSSCAGDKTVTTKEFIRDIGAWHNMSLPPMQTHQHMYSGDDTPIGSTTLRRGRPNSTKSGLQSPLLKQSAGLGVVSTTLPVGRRDLVAVIDTSPILARSEVRTTCDENKENVVDSEVVDQIDEEFNLAELPRYPSKISIDMGSEMLQDESTHNLAFTESMLMGSELPAPLDDNSTDDFETSQDHNGDVSTCVAECDMSMLQSGNDVELSNVHTILDSEHISMKPVLQPEREDQQLDNQAVVQSKEPAQGSTTSLDSAVDVGSPILGSSDKINRTLSQHSVTSHDSGLCIATSDPIPGPICLAADGSIISPPEHSSLKFTREGSRSIRIRSSIRRHTGTASSIAPNLQVTADLHNLLSKAGVPVEEVVSLPIAESADLAKDNLGNTAETVVDGRPVGSTVNDLRELFERHTSPLRFANSTSRTLRVNSPTVQSKVKSDAGVSGKPPLSSKRLPILPISTNLLRVSYEGDCITVKSGKSAGSSNSSIPCTPNTATGPPRIKSALLTPSMAQRLGSKVNAPLSQAVHIRSPGKPVKRLQVSPARTQRSPKNQSPRCGAGSNRASATISVPFNLDI